MKRVLVAGATGYIGKYAVREFKKEGYSVCALTRNEKKLESFGEFIDEIRVGEITDPESLRGICDGIDIVFSSIGITKQKDNLTYMDVDYGGNKYLLDEALKSGVSKFIYISVFGADELSKLKIICAKLKFEEALKQSGIDYAIIRPNGFFSDILEFFEMAKKGRGYVFGTGEYKMNPIHGADLAEVCVNAVGSSERIIKVGGPDILTHNEILKLAFTVLDKPVKITKIHLWINKMLLAFLRTFTSVKTFGPLEFFMTVLARNMVAPSHGSRHLADFFTEQADSA